MWIFKIMKDHGPKNPYMGYNLGVLIPSPSCYFFQKKDQFSVLYLSIYIVVLVLDSNKNMKRIQKL